MQSRNQCDNSGNRRDSESTTIKGYLTKCNNQEKCCPNPWNSNGCDDDLCFENYNSCDGGRCIPSKKEILINSYLFSKLCSNMER